MTPAALFAKIKASAEKFREAPGEIKRQAAAALTEMMTERAAATKRSRHGAAAPSGGGVLVRVYTSQPHFGAAWRARLERVVRHAMAEAGRA